ncbi:MAG: DEAD/DEAH box helicase [Pseudomonadales bacterium]|nr:DEAD/DEAH box helicase [Pseudomonadales bacterium]
MSDDSTTITFQQLGLPAPLMKAVAEVGYETPSSIQAKSIPFLLEGNDLLGQAQTGTGKTAAFALPLLARLDLKQKNPQILVLAPTRELAIQVAEAFQTYSRFLKGFHVLPIYGGQDYSIQLRQLRRGVHVVVGTPGRVMDHIRKGTLILKDIKALVLDEADEMLRMGFIDDVEWILEQTPDDRQMALFSATMPKEIHRVATRYLKNPKEIKIASTTTTATTIRQRYWQVSGLHKLDALTRVLEAEVFDAMIIFVRTKTVTVELAEKLAARGHSCAPLNGDIAQNRREKTVERLKKGSLDIIIATDVAARGLDVMRITHVVNYDIPYDTEAYVHRIGRTGRAGNKGDAILFVAPREKRLLRSIEKATGQIIEHMKMPTVADINEQRVEKFKQKITDTLDSVSLDFFQRMMVEYQGENGIDPVRLAAALAHMAQGDNPLLLKEQKERKPRKERDSSREDNPRRGARSNRSDRGDDRGSNRGPRKNISMEGLSSKADALKTHPEIQMERFIVDVGRNQGVKPGNIVGAVANEADIESQYIGQIEIMDDFSVIDLPAGMPKETMQVLKKARVCGRPMNMVSFSSSQKEDRKEGRQSHSKSSSSRSSSSRSSSSGSSPSGESSESSTSRPPSKSSSKRQSDRKGKELGPKKKRTFSKKDKS